MPLQSRLIAQVLMDAFYAALAFPGSAVGTRDNMTKAEARNQAQIALITGQQRINSSLPPQVSNRLGHPFYWAPFILIGNGLLP